MAIRALAQRWGLIHKEQQFDDDEDPLWRVRGREWAGEGAQAARSREQRRPRARARAAAAARTRAPTRCA